MHNDQIDMNKCFFCNADLYGRAGLTQLGGSTYGTNSWHCPRCGGYVLPDLFEFHEPDVRDPDNKFKIACVLQEHNRTHDQDGLVGVFPDNMQPCENSITEHLIRWWHFSDILSEFPGPHEIMDRALVRCSSLAGDDPFKSITMSIRKASNVFFSRSGYHHIYNELKDSGLLSSFNDSMDAYDFTITTKGWKRVAELQQSQVNPDSQQGFIAMWFDETMKPLWKDGFEAGILDAGYKPDILWGLNDYNDDICDRIIAGIRKSRFVVADCTAGKCQSPEACDDCAHDAKCNDKIRARGGVYYEAGYAHGLGLEVIFTVRQDQVGNLHFDTNHFPHIVYKDADDLRAKLTDRIIATVGRGTHKEPDK